MRPHQLNRTDYTGTTGNGKHYFCCQKNNTFTKIAINATSRIVAIPITIIEPTGRSYGNIISLIQTQQFDNPKESEKKTHHQKETKRNKAY